MLKILEMANTHGGNLDYILSTLKEFEDFKDYDIKFQPFKYDYIALPDYDYYDVYKSLYFNNNTWNHIFKETYKSKNIWIDIFDKYGVEIFQENFKLIKGIKLQVSILDNSEVISNLEALDLSEKILIINISSLELDQIENYLKKFNEKFNFKEIVLQFGHQSYPTKIVDSGLNKIKVLKNKFQNRLIYADHTEATSNYVTQILAAAVLLGVDGIEKHIKNSIMDTKYDSISSIDFKTLKKLDNELKISQMILETNFVNESELDYFEKTNQLPVINQNFERGDILNVNELVFRRTNKKGLKLNEIESILSNDYYVLNEPLNQYDLLKQDHFKIANIGVVIAARMKSSRLKQKAILPIGEKTSIDWCIESCKNILDSQNIVLATSYLEEDKVLQDYALKQKINYFEGNPDDVIERFYNAAIEFQFDVILRVTGDCPFISNEIANYLLEEHFRFGADFTYAKEISVGTSVEVINTSALEKLILKKKNRGLSEYMSYYFFNNPNIFKVNAVDLPPKYVRNYRLTLDYEEDLILFNKIVNILTLNRKNVNVANIFDLLDKRSDLTNINSHIKLKYKSDENLLEKLRIETKI